MLTVSGSRPSQQDRSLAPAAGVTAPPTGPSPHRFLSDLIIERRLVEPSVMRAALQASLAGRSLTEILLAKGALSEHDLAHTLAEHHGLDHIDLDAFEIDECATALIEPHVARRLGAVPIAFLADDTVVLVLHEPNGSTAAVELAHLTGRTIQPAVASRSQIEAVIAGLLAQRRPRIASGPAPAEPPARVAKDRRPPLPKPVAALAPAATTSEAAAPAVDAPAAIGAASLGGRLSMHFDGELQTLVQRAELAERRRRDAEERAAEVQELARVEAARADAAEQRAAAAEALVDAAEARSQEMAGSVAAANDALARLLRACETVEREAQSHGRKVAALQAAHEEASAEQARREEALRAELETERDEIARLEVRLLGELETERGDRARLEVALRQARAPDDPVSPPRSERKLRRGKDPRRRGG